MTKPDIRALSIIQPWADAIAYYGKNVENRSWSTQRRGYIAIHASQKKDKDLFLYLKEDYRLSLDIETSSFGAIIAFAKIVDVITNKDLTRKTKKWFSGEYGLVLEEIIVLKNPVQAKGALGFWKVQPATLNKCFQQLSQKHQRRILTNSQP